MRFSIISTLILVGAGMVSALPSDTIAKRDLTTEQKVSQAAATLKGNTVDTESEVSSCIGPLLCCSSLSTPLDHIVDPILKDLGIDAAAIVGSIGLLCDPYAGSGCTTAPQCCTEANLLGGTVALGCSTVKA